MGFSSRELMALVGAHSTGKQRFVDTTQANSTFDTTVDIWDTRFCKQNAPGQEQNTLTRLISDTQTADTTVLPGKQLQLFPCNLG
jgi:L-ascorbate peroxidase